MVHLITSTQSVVIQKARGGIAPRRQLLLGPQIIAELQRHMEEEDCIVYRRVTAERAEAVTRGVQLVVDETRPDHYMEIQIHD